MNINEYAFVDCYILDFFVDSYFKDLTLVTEAYYPMRKERKRQKGSLKLELENITKLGAEMTTEFSLDLLSKSKKKDNEVYEIKISILSNGLFSVFFRSDFINLNVECKSYVISELDREPRN